MCLSSDKLGKYCVCWANIDHSKCHRGYILLARKLDNPSNSKPIHGQSPLCFHDDGLHPHFFPNLPSRCRSYHRPPESQFYQHPALRPRNHAICRSIFNVSECSGDPLLAVPSILFFELVEHRQFSRGTYRPTIPTLHHRRPCPDRSPRSHCPLDGFCVPCARLSRLLYLRWMSPLVNDNSGTSHHTIPAP